MHIPDGFIPGKWARANLDEKRIPLLAVLAAGIFAIMSMNMPIPFGTSGHMVGGALVAIVFMAPEAAVLVFTAVLLIQALFFGDGGITALGANVLNMGIVGGCVGLYTFKGLKDIIGKYPSIFVAAWLATLVAAVVAAIEMAIAGTFPLTVGIASMALYHAFIGIIEGVLTVIVIYALEKFRPDLLAWNRE